MIFQKRFRPQNFTAGLGGIKNDPIYKHTLLYIAPGASRASFQAAELWLWPEVESRCGAASPPDQREGKALVSLISRA